MGFKAGTLSDESLRKMSVSHKAAWASRRNVYLAGFKRRYDNPAYIEKLRILAKERFSGRRFSAKHRERISIANKGKVRTPEMRARISVSKKACAIGLMPHNKGKTKFDYEPLYVVSRKLSGRRQTEEHRLHHSLTKQSLMKDPAYKSRFISRLMSACSRKPNGAENRFLKACDGLPIRYTGDGSFMLGYKNPDFIVLGQQKVIEVMGMYFHDRKLNSTVLSHRTVNSTVSYYKRIGYDCLIVNHNSTFFPKHIRRKVLKFIGGEVGCVNECVPDGIGSSRRLGDG